MMDTTIIEYIKYDTHVPLHHVHQAQPCILAARNLITRDKPDPIAQKHGIVHNR